MKLNQLWMAAHWICSVCAQRKIYCLDFSCSEGNCTFEHPLVLLFTLHICHYLLAWNILANKNVFGLLSVDKYIQYLIKPSNLIFSPVPCFLFGESWLFAVAICFCCTVGLQAC